MKAPSHGAPFRSAWIFAVRVFVVAVFAGAIFVVVSGAGARAQTPHTAEVMVIDAWGNPPLVPQNNMAVYLTLTNPTDAPRLVVSVTTNDAASAGLHQTQMTGKMTMMTPVASLLIPAKGSVQLKPGGYHIMCTGVNKPLKPGDQMKLMLKLDDGKTIPVTVKVRALDAATESGGGQGMKMPMPSTQGNQK